MIKIRGPFWTADANVITLADPRTHSTFRALFADSTPRASGNSQLHLPGTMLLLLDVRRVTIRLAAVDATFSFTRPFTDSIPGPNLTPAAIRDLLQKGKASLLLATMDPTKWVPDFDADDIPEATCVLGDIGVDGLTPDGGNTRVNLYKAMGLVEVPLAPRSGTGAARLLSGLTVHASGLSALGKLTPLWDSAPITAPFQLARELPGPAADQPRYRLTVEDQRLTDAERAAWLASWERFARLVDPGHPAFASSAGPRVVPRWGTLEVVNLRRVPRLYWELGTAPFNPNPANLPIKVEKGELGVILADQDPRDGVSPPTSIARVNPDSVSIALVGAAKNLQVSVNAGGAPPTGAQPQFKYTATKAAGAWTEGVVLSNLVTAFDPIATARATREALGLEAPVWDRSPPTPKPIEPPVAFAALRLDDGWAQLPVPNLTEQLYLDAGLAVAPTDVKPKLAGAVSFGNAKAGVLQPGPREQAWSITVLDAPVVTGTWTCTGISELTKLDITLFSPVTVIDGLFWFGTARPSVEDALPALDDWLGALQSLPVTTVRATDPFPAPIVLAFEDITLGLAATSAGFPTATLSAWRATYDANADLIKRMQDKRLLPSDVFSRALPLVWRHHPTLPMVQALPLTQNQVPPSAPSASRQLVPFELPVATATGLPQGWKLGSPAKPAAEAWPVVLSAVAPASEWLLSVSSNGQELLRRGADLPLVSLSLPGLQLAPVKEPNGLDNALGLVTQYRLDLPYVDQLHALAQLPRLPNPPSLVVPLPVAQEQKRERPSPLGRADLAGHFSRLAEKAALAAAELVSVVAVGANGKPEVRGLAEPSVWPIKATLETAAYPGRLILDNQTGTAAPLELTGDQALRGIEGVFAEEGATSLRRVVNGDGFELTGGSMADRRTAAEELRDQRGLLRVAVTLGAKLTRTRLKLVEAADAFTLTSALQAFELAVGPEAIATTERWRFWFRDLPFKTGGFERGATLSDPGRDQDINDPEGRERRYEALGGYEWRLASRDPSDTGISRKLFGLDFFPLTLEAVTLDGEEIASIALVGRLQLPLAATPREDEDLTNAVRLTFTRPAPGKLPALSEVKLVSPEGAWMLTRQGAAGDAPRITWTSVALGADKASLTIGSASLLFNLFDADWRIPLSPLVFGASPAVLRQAYAPAVKPVAEPLAPARVTLELDVTRAKHTAILELSLLLGSGVKDMPAGARSTPLVWQLAPATTPPPGPVGSRSAFRSTISFLLTSGESGKMTWLSGALFEDLALPTDERTAATFVDNSLQFRWSSHVVGAGRPQLLPGMALTPGGSSGFATLAFDVITPPDPAKDVPTLPVRSSFVEAFLPCKWGEYLQGQSAASSTSAVQLYGSSAGDVFFGFSGQSSNTVWTQSLLANGMIEVKSLISLPFALSYDDPTVTLTLPATRATPSPALSHLRHTVRVLLDQHLVPVDALVTSSGDLLFKLASGKSWQFLATVEHQLLEVVPDATGALAPRRDRRFVAAQEVRFLSPAGFKNALNAISAREMPGVGLDQDPIGEASFGPWGKAFKDALVTGSPSPLDALGDALVVEASAPLLVRQSASTTVAATALQFLPSGTQLGSLSDLDDFLPGDPAAPPWGLVRLPFFGRLQDTARDGAAAPPASAPTALQVDPVLQLDRLRSSNPSAALPALLLALTHRGDNKNEAFRFAAFDAPVGRLFARLDTTSVEESWFRLQAPASEPVDASLGSVLRSLPDSPARLGRPAALARLRDPARAKYPPAAATPSIASDELQEAPVWRPKSILLWHAVANRSAKDALYPFHLVGVELWALGFLGKPPAGAAELVTHVAVAVLPTNPAQWPTPESLALAPFARLGFLPAPAERADSIVLLTAELLCLDESRTRVISAARHVWQKVAASERGTTIESWARDTQRSLCPTSPFAIVRERAIVRTKDEPGPSEAAVVTDFAFRVVAIERAPELKRRSFALRSKVKDLKFRDGRFGGAAIPSAIRPFEVAPPLVSGVQPLRLEGRPGPAPSVPPPVRPGKASAAPLWNFGWSGLRVAVEPAARGIAGAIEKGVPGASVWWLGIASSVQFRAAASKLPTAGLPSGFRARAVESLLPVLPRPPLPPNIATRLGDDGLAFSWQPMLPGQVRFITVGQRAGVLHAYRSALQRQAIVDTQTPGSAEVMVSGSVPIQHRFPRPVALPATSIDDPELALRTWASAFDTTSAALITRAPSDEAFFAGDPGGANASRLAMRIVEPPLGVAPPDWNGKLVFAATATAQGTMPAWQLLVRVVIGSRTFTFTTSDSIQTGTVTFSVNRDDPAIDPVPALRAALAGAGTGESVALDVRVARDPGPNAYFQALSFNLRAEPMTPTELRAPLVPVFAHFEDPEYNRRLASTAKQARLDVKLSDNTIATAILSADREQYTPDVVVVLRYDGSTALDQLKPLLSFARVEPSGVLKPLTLAREGGVGPDPAQPLSDGSVLTFGFSQLLELVGNRQQVAVFTAGQALRVTLKLQPGDFTTLDLPIVDEPQLPVPQAAFALLRRTHDGGAVQCVRFAWMPPAQRIELLDPRDLKVGLVRRRAVFHWTDTARAGAFKDFALQKITAAGSTHMASFIVPA